jgi:hypothetical protein
MAAEQLVELGASDRVSVPLLVADLKSNAGESVCAAEALAFAGHQNMDVIRALGGLLNERDPDVRRRAAYIASALGARSKTLLPALEQAQRDGVPGAALAARVVRDAVGRTPKTTRKRK